MVKLGGWIRSDKSSYFWIFYFGKFEVIAEMLIRLKNIESIGVTIAMN